MDEYDRDGRLSSGYIRDPTALRPAGFMENPFIGLDGRDYHNSEDLFRVNRGILASQLIKEPTLGVDCNPIFYH